MNECAHNINFTLAEMLLCYDIRLKDELNNINKNYNYNIKYLRNKLFKLRNKFKNNEIKMLHIGKLGWIDLNIIIIKYNKYIYNNFNFIDIYKYRRIITLDGIIDFVLLPRNLEDFVINRLDRMNADIVLYGEHSYIPFQCGYQGVEVDYNDETKSRSDKLLDVILYSRLEDNPLISLKELSKFNVNDKILIKFRYKKINKRYRKLSKNKVLGRMVSLCTGYGSYIIYLRDLGLLESLIGRYFIAAELVRVDREALVVAYCSKFNNLDALLNDYYDSIVFYSRVASIKNYGIPFNFYSHIEGWSLVRQNVYSSLKRLGLVI